MKNFKYGVNGQKYFVTFKHFNDLVVKCEIHDLTHDVVFKGKAKVNTEDGDVYSMEEGERISFEKALEKRDKFYATLRKQILFDIDFQRDADAIALTAKFVREQTK